MFIDEVFVSERKISKLYNFFTVKLSLITINGKLSFFIFLYRPQFIILHYLPALMYLFMIFFSYARGLVSYCPHTCEINWVYDLPIYTRLFLLSHLLVANFFFFLFLLNNFISYLFNLMNQFIWSISFSDDWLLAKIGNKKRKNEYNVRENANK